MLISLRTVYHQWKSLYHNKRIPSNKKVCLSLFVNKPEGLKIYSFGPEALNIVNILLRLNKLVRIKTGKDIDPYVQVKDNGFK